MDPDEDRLPELKKQIKYPFSNSQSSIPPYKRLKDSLDPSNEKNLIKLGNALLSPTLAKLRAIEKE